MDPERDLQWLENELDRIEKDARNTDAIIRAQKDSTEQEFIQEIQEISKLLKAKADQAKANVRKLTEANLSKVKDVLDVTKQAKESLRLLRRSNALLDPFQNAAVIATQIETEKEMIGRNKNLLKEMRENTFHPTSQLSDMKSRLRSPELLFYHRQSSTLSPSQLSIQLHSESLLVGNQVSLEVCGDRGGETDWPAFLHVAITDTVTGNTLPRKLVPYPSYNSCRITFTPDSAGRHRVEVSIYQQPIKGSPLSFTVQPQTLFDLPDTARALWTPTDSLPPSQLPPATDQSWIQNGCGTSASGQDVYASVNGSQLPVINPLINTSFHRGRGRGGGRGGIFPGILSEFEKLQRSDPSYQRWERPARNQEFPQSSESSASGDATRGRGSPVTGLEDEWLDLTLAEKDTCDVRWNEERITRRRKLNFRDYVNQQGVIRAVSVCERIGGLRGSFGCTINSENGDFVVCNSSANQVEVYHSCENGNRPNIRMKIKDLDTPSSVVPIRTLNRLGEMEDMYAIKDNRNISLFSCRSGELVRKMGADRLRFPFGLVLSDDGYLVTINTKSNGPSGKDTEVLFFSPKTGKVVKSFPLEILDQVPGAREGASGKSKALNEPLPKVRFMDAWDGNIVCTDLGRDKAYISSQNDGSLISNPFGGPGDSPGYFRKVSGVSIDGYGNMLIGGGCKQTIQMFDRTGKYVARVNLEGPNVRGEMKSVSGVAVSDDARLIFSSAGSGFAAVFRLVKLDEYHLFHQ